MKGIIEADTHYVDLPIKLVDKPLDVDYFDESVRSSPGDGVWRSNGGTHRGHFARSFPYTLELPLSELKGSLAAIELTGVFARFADSANEAVGTLGGTVHILEGTETVFRQDLFNGRHYRDAEELTPLDQFVGDGTSITSIGEACLDGVRVRVDRLTIDLPSLVRPEKLVFRDLGSSASFLISRVRIEIRARSGCPFHSRSGLIPLREVGAIVRVGDRRRFGKALAQLCDGVQAATDLDEARGLALTFIAVVTAGMLELGGSRDLHRVQLEAARALEPLTSKDEISSVAVEFCERISASLFTVSANPTTLLVDRALAIVERNYAKNLTDAVVAEQLGLSTSHFRFLFKQATGNPFHKFLIATRLEKAKQMLASQEMPVSQVAAAVGFTGLSHFSRAFAQRFAVSPSSVRRLNE